MKTHLLGNVKRTTDEWWKSSLFPQVSPTILCQSKASFSRASSPVTCELLGGRPVSLTIATWACVDSVELLTPEIQDWL